MNLDRRIAIVGMAGLFPGAPNLPRFWHNLAQGIDSSRDVPSYRWTIPPEEAFDPMVGTKDRVYSTRGYFLDPFTPNLSGLDINIDLVNELDVLYHLALHLGNEAFRDAKMDRVHRGRIGVILGSIALPTEKMSQLAEEILGQRFAEALGRNLSSKRTNSFNNRVTGFPASLIAKALSLGGTHFTLDAACASSLYALKLACDELLSGRVDAMLAGGLSRPDCLYTQMGFAQLRALSRTGKCSPFDAQGDGLVVGEGGGIFVLKRLVDAINHQDRIYGVICGIGLSNDIEGNLLAPSSEGQLRAMRTAYQEANWSPTDVDLIECHATGTPVGDAVEFRSLQQLWSNQKSLSPCVIGSVKSSVGHLLTGANSASLAKVLLAFQNESLPPSANFHQPGKDIRLSESPFRILQHAERWDRRNANFPRRAALSGFGFGGINAHLLIEEWLPETSSSISVPTSPVFEEPIAVVGIGASFGPWKNRHQFRERILGGPNDDHPTYRSGVGDGFFIEAIDFPYERFRIPPKEVEEMLPQQALTLLVCDEAIQDTSSKMEPLRTGVFIGVSLDPNTTNFHLRWSIGQLGKAQANLEAWMDAVSPPLTANRTMGALASIAASRVARAFGIGGPSFTISGEEQSGLRGIELAISALRKGEIDHALVGAVDLVGDPRLANKQTLCDGAGAVILKRLSDAQRDGDTIYAMITKTQSPLDAKIDLVEPNSSIQNQIGYAGAATGIATFIRSCFALHEQILPPRRIGEDRVTLPQFWLQNDTDGPRRALIVTSAKEDLGLELEEYPIKKNQSLHPLGYPSSAVFLFGGDDINPLLRQLDELHREVESSNTLSISELANRWWKSHSSEGSSCRASIVARNLPELTQRISDLRKRIRSSNSSGAFEGIAWNLSLASSPDRIAFVYPGSGNHFAGMGREFGVYFPNILRQQQRENRTLRSQYAPQVFWSDSSLVETDGKTLIFGQVALGTLISDLLIAFNVHPQVAIGNSLGESASLFGLRVWRDRDAMLRRMNESTLFVSDLAPPFNAARLFWNLSDSESIDWVVGMVPCPASLIREQLHPDRRVYLLILPTENDCVIGGIRSDVERLLSDLRVSFLPISGVTLAHCEVTKPIEKAYRDLHTLPVTVPPGVQFFSGASGNPYEVTTESAAESILAGVQQTIDFTQIMERAYLDGVRLFVEIGPGSSCSRMIDIHCGNSGQITLPICSPNRDNLYQLMVALGAIFIGGADIDLAPLYGNESKSVEENRKERSLTLPVGYIENPLPEVVPFEEPIIQRVVYQEPIQYPSPVMMKDVYSSVPGLFESQTAVAEAHETFLRFSTSTQQYLQGILQQQTQLLQQVLTQPDTPILLMPDRQLSPRSLTPEECQEFATGLIGNVLGNLYREIDQFPTRVRLPDGPLLLVDRILLIEGEPCSLGSGRVVTDHHVHENRWYLDNGRIPTSISVESGQADLFLSGYLGIDFQTRGLAVYRLLDAVVTFHDELPKPGDVIVYDIHIDHFFQQGETYLFRFRFEGTVNGKPFLSMRDGCAGFFSESELASGKGIVHTQLDKRPLPGKRPRDWCDWVPMQQESFTSGQVESLRRGDLVGALGDTFSSIQLRSPMRLPGGMLRLVDRVSSIDPHAGRYGLGMIRAEFDIHPDDWFLTCHFVDDQVMPGTLMYECCLHTLRIFLMRMGWIGEEGEITCEPIPEVPSRLKCRGQVIASTKIVTYEVTIKELGYRPEAFAIADALMYADGKPIVEITDMTLRMTGLTKERLQEIWNPSSESDIQPAIFDTDRILAFAVGKPSEAFGEPYRIFDDDRTIARLPGPPYKFLDRITRIHAEPWKMVAGGEIEAQYDVPLDAWYFEANRSNLMPFSILLEVALQPCGWLAAFIGSALTSKEDLSFRNLGGSAIQYLPVTPDMGTLTTHVKITKVSNSAGMIIQHYDYRMTSRGRDVYQGNTYFGFFSKSALANQIGIRDAKWVIPEGNVQSPIYEVLPHEHPFPDSMLRMIDKILWYTPHNSHGLDAIEGSIAVDPDFWFFKAHFYQDPVWPGSLGLESFIQLLKYLAWKRWGEPRSSWQTVALNQKHEWIYRGQVIPRDEQVRVQALVTSIDDENRLLRADGFLMVDERIIYQMKDFTLQGL